ncbi:hypothetical protein CO009_00905 [Candidatus Shapirobacteria bacterium CG_4_8_14_3_um_filter_35_11]|uniref:CopG family transcriptional regulator n=3 Tax=Candidatus Shapironibacteriota TaxID=1752721 RepID=A0A2M7XP72_9BACT|nr:MAG: hypothetical protein CO168_00145 [Candidatus Shapirobacteria bacterium CG_4_9_14_3_um_filter_36_12]PJC80886.1 MAG: hypothetical protein CO009_00905 [Candidatus Shapirobacteria bacterium CG_4_8_14_3_um_filter_35_11]PJE66831.1 MAG: hypothetical protein COU93_02135 [Candidatus Shapirobacteria bacterium CG10_big_fil_rev_8_21_14_0_10_36_6]
MNKKLKQRPDFKNEDDERNFWDSHDLSDYFDMSHPIKMSFPNLKLSNELISFRLPSGLLDVIKVEAHKRDMPYQSLMKAGLYELFMGKKRITRSVGASLRG